MYFPDDFLQMMRTVLPAGLSMESFVEFCQRPLRRSIRVNTLKISVADFLALVVPYGWRLTQIPWCEQGFWLERDDEAQCPLGSAAEHLSGLFYIQEASSMLPVSALLDATMQAGCVLDMAAAPGSKTTQLAAGMQNQGVLLANEYSASRIKVLHANVSRCGVANVALTHFDGRVFRETLTECFDAVLLDAPCSGEGMVRKDVDALRGWSASRVASIAVTQRQLIDSAFHALRPGGVLVYSTCTLNRTENQQVCEYLLTHYADALEILPLDDLFAGAARAVTAEGFLHVFPQLFDSEGFFVARLRKTRSIASVPVERIKQRRFPFTPMSVSAAYEVVHAAAAVGLRWGDSLALWQREKEIWLFPKAVNPLLGRIRFSRIGVKLALQHNKGYRWQHEAAIALSKPDNPQAFALEKQEAQLWYQGRDIYPAQLPEQSEVIVSFQGQPIGLAKKIGGRLKNYYPRELVRNGKLFVSD